MLIVSVVILAALGAVPEAVAEPPLSPPPLVESVAAASPQTEASARELLPERSVSSAPRVNTPGRLQRFAVTGAVGLLGGFAGSLLGGLGGAVIGSVPLPDFGARISVGPYGGALLGAYLGYGLGVAGAVAFAGDRLGNKASVTVAILAAMAGLAEAPILFALGPVGALSAVALIGVLPWVTALVYELHSKPSPGRGDGRATISLAPTVFRGGGGVALAGCF